MAIPRYAIAVLLMCTAQIGWGQASPEDHAAHHPPAKTQMMESTADLAPIRGLLERAEHAKTTSERERLLDEHLAAMRKLLASRNSQECMMDRMEGATTGPKRPDNAKAGMMGDGMKMDQMMACHQVMKNRMDTMAELLEQTWRREELRKKGAR